MATVPILAARADRIITRRADRARRRRRTGRRLDPRITYGDLAVACGYSRRAARVMIRPVAVIAWWCHRHRRAQRNALVVRVDTGRPGDNVLVPRGSTVAREQRAACFDTA